MNSQTDGEQPVTDNQSETEVVYDEEIDGKSPDQQKLLKLKKKMEECRQQKEEYLAGWQRSQADFINYRKRQEEQMKEWQKLTNERLIMDLMPILDSLEQGSRDEGVRLIKEQFQQTLKNYGLERLKTVGEKFNPEVHEAVASVDSDEQENNLITEELQAGYTLNGRLIKPAKVKIIKK